MGAEEKSNLILILYLIQQLFYLLLSETIEMKFQTHYSLKWKYNALSN